MLKLASCVSVSPAKIHLKILVKGRSLESNQTKIKIKVMFAERSYKMNMIAHCKKN